MALIWAALQLREWLGTDERAQDWNVSIDLKAVCVSLLSLLPGWRQTVMYLGALLLGAASVLAFDLYEEWNFRRRKHVIQKEAFPFMKLPAELRAEVFSYLIEPHGEPDERRVDRNTFRDKVVIDVFRVSGDIVMYLHDHTTHIINALHESPTKSLLQLLGYDARSIAAQLENYKLEHKSRRHPLCRHLNSMRLVSKQFSKEFFTTYLIHAEPVFTAESSGIGENPFGLWQHSLPLLKRCTLRLIARPDIANAFNPLHAKIKDWSMRDSIFASMRQMTSLQAMTLNIEACGNQLWNPVQLWYFTSQAFKACDVMAFDRIQFTMKDWKMNMPNDMVRTAGVWEWRCQEGHFVVEDEKDIPIRKWAGRLYKVCDVCAGGYDDSERLNEDLVVG